jgi:DNA (cytosine-5)-methyltransferase 1
VADAAEPRSQGRAWEDGSSERGLSGQSAGGHSVGFWSGAEWLAGADGKARRVKSGVRLLADGISARVGRLRGYGNAVVPQVAAAFVTAFMEV